MKFTTLLYDVADRIATVTVNRPDKLNALDAAAKSELLELFLSIAKDPAVDVVILTGAGEKSFVAGTDIGELAALDADTGREYSAGGQAVFDAIEGLGKPVIAAVNGYALGGGCELALACHIRIAAENAKFGQPEVNLGIIPGYGGTQRLARLVGRGRAIEMILTGNQIGAMEALGWGLVTKVVPAAVLKEEARAMARTIQGKGQVAVHLALKAVQAAEESGLVEGQQIEAGLFGECCGTEDFKEGTAAFLAKRKAVFKGK
jgi:enoyl-CoA hydratase